ncbi:MAG: methylated-DNA--[protein]-cysteine S-methyltransferase [Deltaproteobacteria bacterium]|nr:methylated-DNA--[protein]-cysteine S-methyltransferase [Deltaproteobacteria bacterium]MBW2305370.1 methylated-DNA--[protein]-cysteine S-methyltransferase [Deltaproteobacteria bacterium]
MRASRAVVHTVAANPLFLVVRRHRVIRADGGPGGYYFRLPYKQRLLAIGIPPHIPRPGLFTSCPNDAIEQAEKECSGRPDDHCGPGGGVPVV